MKMTGLEKRFVNRRRKAENNIHKIRSVLSTINTETIKDVLEIGCGIGLVAAYLAADLSFEVYGTDFDTDEIKLAREFNQESDRLHYRVEDAAKLSFTENSFDLLIAQNVFHHIPDWPAAIVEIRRVLRPGGYLIWFDLVFSRLIKSLFKPLTKNYGLYTAEDIRIEFEKAGFKIVQTQKMAHGPFRYYEMVLLKS
jgi:ubiquinone/menaquinone biosynthesis C-methylase UbiE